MSSSIPGERIRGLDGLRFLAFFSVFWFHLDLLHGWWGVDLFFVISGFLITGILLDSSRSPGGLRAFYIRRALRILPAYYLFVLAMFSIGFITGGNRYLAAVLTYTTNLSMAYEGIWRNPGHLWSLAQEEQFYLLWPFAIYFLTRRGLISLCISMIVISIIGKIWAFFASVSPTTTYLVPLFRLDGLALGALFALQEREGWSVFRLWKRYSLFIFLAGFTVVLLGTDGYLYNDHRPFWPVLGYTVVTITMGSLFLFVRNSSQAQRLLEFFPFVYLGTISYGLYLWTPALQLISREMNVLSKANLSPAQCSFAALLVSLYITMFSWHFIEKPILKLKDRFPYKKG